MNCYFLTPLVSGSMGRLLLSGVWVRQRNKSAGGAAKLQFGRRALKHFAKMSRTATITCTGYLDTLTFVDLGFLKLKQLLNVMIS